VRANRRWWDADADSYHTAHGTFLGVADFVWSPERLGEADAHLLGDVAGKLVLEVGCGAAMCSRWLAEAGARPVAFDNFRRHAAPRPRRRGRHQDRGSARAGRPRSSCRSPRQRSTSRSPRSAPCRSSRTRAG